MAFPSTYLNLAVEIALAADLTANPSTWAWTDVTEYVRTSDNITIRRGGYDGALQAPPSTCSFRVDNRDGRWVPSNPSGAWYGQLTKNTPVRVKVDEGTPSVRWTGFLTELPPRWNLKETDRYVLVTASGILRRLQRGSTPLRSPLVRAVASLSPVAYWPGEDGSQSTSIAEFFGGQPMQIVGQVATLADDSPSGSKPLPEFTTVAGVNGLLPTRAAGTGWSVASLINFPAAPSAETSVMRWYTSGSYKFWQIVLNPASPDTLEIQAYDSTGTQQIGDTVNFVRIDDASVEAYGEWVLIAATAEQNGTDVDYLLTMQFPGGGRSTSGLSEANITAGAVTRIGVNANSKVNGMHAGHWAVWDEALDVTADFSLIIAARINGGDGETVPARVLGLGAEVTPVEGKVSVTGDATDLRMGPQTLEASRLDQYREAEAVGNGRLYETRNPASGNRFLTLAVADALCNQDAALTLDHDSGHLADLQPTDDDQHFRNDWTVTRTGGSGAGSAARAVATGDASPESAGTYADSTSVNVYSDDDLPHQAGWRLNLTRMVSFFDTSEEAVRWRVCWHEAAHAVVACALGVEVGSVELHPNDGHGVVKTRPVDPETDATVQMAGKAATPFWPADYDTREAVRLVGADGAQDAADRARGLLKTRGPALRAIAEELDRTGRIDGPDVLRIYTEALAG